MTATFKKIRKAAILIIIASLFLQHSVLAQDAVLQNIIVTNTRDDLLVYLSVEGAFREKMIKAIFSGVPTSFSFFIELYQVRNLWPDKKLADIKITHTIKYDNLKKEFTVIRSWNEDKPVTTQSFLEARKLMSDVDGINVVPLKLLEKGRRYQIQAKAQLSKLTLPFYLHYVLFFVSLWDFETDWYSIDFIY